MLIRRRSITQDILIKDVNIVGNPFITRTTAEGKKLNRSLAKIQSIEGNTLVWNQCVKNGDFSSGTTNWQSYGDNTTIQAVNGALKVIPGVNNGGAMQTIGIKANHHCYVRCYIDVPEGGGGTFMILADGTTKKTQQVTSGASNVRVHTMYIRGNGDTTIFIFRFPVAGKEYYIRNICVFDFTCIYGAGKEPSTMIDFARNFPLIYYNYTSGSLLNFTATSLASKDTVGTTIGTANLDVTTITGRVDGEGESVVIFPDGMKSGTYTPAGSTSNISLYDTITKEDGVWVAYKRIGSVNLGALTWSYVYGSFRSSDISDSISYDDTAKRYVLVTADYPSDIQAHAYNKTIYGGGAQKIYIKDSAYSDEATFKTAMSGKYLYYQLATPIKYILDNQLDEYYKVVTGGVEQILPENEAIPTTSPAKLNIKYKTTKPTQLIKVSLTNTNLRSCRVLYGLPYSIRISPYDGFSLYEDPIIKMGGVDITSTAYDPTYNMISIPSVTGDVEIECYAMHTMPSDYVRVDGIKNPDNAYLNTDYVPSLYTKVLVDALPDSNSAYIVANKTASWTSTYATGVRRYLTSVRAFFNNEEQNLSNPYTVGERFVVICDNYNGKLYYNGTLKKSFQRVDANDNYALCLFSRDRGNESSNSVGTIIYRTYIYDYSTNSYVRYYIPCLNDSGVAGFWDAARGVFQGSSNSTAFEAVAADGGDFRLIDFEDSAVKNICVTNWGGHYKAGEMYTPEARAVTSFGNKFERNTEIVKFNEMQYFTGLTTLSRNGASGEYLDGMQQFGAFNRCSNLEEVTLPTITMAAGNGSNRIGALFCRCSKLKSIDMSPITITGSTTIANICGKCTAMTSAVLPTMATHTSYLSYIYAFDACSNLVTIDASNVNFANNNYSNDTNFVGNCSKLTRIIGGLHGLRQTISLTACPLTHDAAVELLESLGTVTEARTLTLKTSTYNTLTAEELAIATDKGWTIAKG